MSEYYFWIKQGQNQFLICWEEYVVRRLVYEDQKLFCFAKLNLFIYPSLFNEIKWTSNKIKLFSKQRACLPAHVHEQTYKIGEVEQKNEVRPCVMQ